jgi:hypothetical protein
MQGNYFAVDHDVYWPIQMKLHAADLADLGQRMLDVSAIVKTG